MMGARVRDLIRLGVFGLIAVAVLAASADAQRTASVALSADPGRVCLEPRAGGQMNFDLVMHNRTDRAITVSQLEASVINTRGEMIEHRIVWQDAVTGLGPHRTLSAGQTGILFNPFTFRTASADTRIRYDVQFEGAAPASITIEPQSCATNARLTLPLTGRILVYDGYDYLSHHRRQTYQLEPQLRAFGVIDNWYRFGIDLIHTDAEGRLHRSDGSRIEDWYAWGQPVRAPGAGVVHAIRNDEPDNDIGTENRRTSRPLSEDEMNSDGNYVLIDHGEGEFSLLSHLKQGSVRVRPGERVRAGQLVGEVGNSGATPVPHLHYELRTSPGFGVRGVRTLPPYFHDLQIIGLGRMPRSGLPVNTGDVLISR